MTITSTPDELFLALQSALGGRYSLERELGRGGMGIVYLARDVQLDRPVALKLLPPEQAAHPERRERFLHEARTAARLAHPNIVPIHSVEDIGSFVFYAMRYVDGETLGARLRRTGELSPTATAAVLRDIAYALAYAHAQRVVHRDIKPDNILLEGDSDRALVTDFGIAWVTDRVDAHQGRVVGTPEYLSPEQAGGDVASASSDLYSLGAVGYHCLAGTPPFAGDMQQLLAQHLIAEAPPLGQLAPHASPALIRAVERLLAKDPALRFASAEDFAEEIAPALSRSSELPVPVRIWSERGREMKGVYAIWSCFFYGVGIMALVGCLIQGLWPWQAVVFMVLCAKATIAPWIAHGLGRLSETRKALESGASFDQLREATEITLARREEELRFEARRPVHPLARLVRRLTYAAFAAAIASLALGVIGIESVLTARDLFGLFGLFTMAGVAGALVGLVFPGRRLGTRDLYARLRRNFWHSRLGTAAARVAAIGLPAARQLAWSTRHGNPTVAGSATVTLFEALPAGEQQRLARLPQVLARLEREAAQARRQMAAGGETVWQLRLERAVAAIESLRLGLLRLTAHHVEHRSLTGDIDAVRELSQQVDYLIAGADSVATLLERDSRSRQTSVQATPTHNPAATSLG